MKRSHSLLTPLFLLLGLMALVGAACGDDAIEVVSGATAGSDTGSSESSGSSGDSGDSAPVSDETTDAMDDTDQMDSDDMDQTDEMPADDMPADEMPADDMPADDMPADVEGREPTIAPEPEPLPGTGDSPDFAVDDYGTEWQLVDQRRDLSDTKSHPILDLVVMDETHIGVRFESIPEGCSGAEAYADETDTEVRIELFVGLPPEAAMTTCMMMQVPKQIVVELAAPLGNRELVTATSTASGDAAAVTPEMSLDDYIGLSEAEAFAKAEASSRRARVVKVNDEFMITTDDYVPSRLNLEIVDGIVTGLKTDAGEEAGDYSGF